MGTVNFIYEDINGLLTGNTQLDIENIFKDAFFKDNTFKDLVKEKIFEIFKNIKSEEISKKWSEYFTNIIKINDNEIKLINYDFKNSILNILKKSASKINLIFENIKIEPIQITKEDIINKINPDIYYNIENYKNLDIFKNIKSEEISKKWSEYFTNIIKIDDNEIKLINNNFKNSILDLLEKIKSKINLIFENIKIEPIQITKEDIIGKIKFNIDYALEENYNKNIKPVKLEESSINYIKEKIITKNITDNEQYIQPVSISSISENVFKKISNIIEPNILLKKDTSKKDESKFSLSDLFSKKALLPLILSGLLSRYLMTTDLPEFWKIFTNFLTDPKYRKVILNTLESGWSKIINRIKEIKIFSFLDNTFAKIDNKINNIISFLKKSKFYNFFENIFTKINIKINDFILSFKKSKFYNFFENTFNQIRNKLDEINDIIKNSKTLNVIQNVVDNFKNVFKKITTFFNIDNISNFLKPITNISEGVETGIKGIKEVGSLSNIFKKVINFFSNTPIGIMFKGLKGAKSVIKFVPIFGDLLSLWFGYERIKKGGTLNIFQGILDIVSGIAGLTGVGQIVSIILDSVNLAIDLARWGYEKISIKAKAEGYSGILDMIKNKIKQIGKDLIIGIYNLLPDTIKMFFNVDDKGNIKFVGNEVIYNYFNDLSGGLLDKTVNFVKETRSKIKNNLSSTWNFLADKLNLSENKIPKQKTENISENTLKNTSNINLLNLTTNLTDKLKNSIKIEKIKTDDLIIDTANKSVIEYQLDNSDHFVQLDNIKSSFIKSGGGLEKLINTLIKSVDNQTNILKEVFINANKILNNINENSKRIIELLPLLKQTTNNENNLNIPTTELRDPIFDYRKQLALRRGF